MQVKACEICSKRAARYVCQECGREVCQFCFEPNTWFCSNCYNRLRGENSAPESFPWQTPFKLFLFGFVLMFIGMVVMMVATVFFGASVSTGTLIWIPPLPPIGFGVGPYPFWVILIALAFTIFGLVLFIMLRRRAR